MSSTDFRTIKCANCESEFNERDNRGFITPKREVVDICSLPCRAEYRNRIAANPKAAVKAGDDGRSPIARRARKPPSSPAAIAKAMRASERSVSASIAKELNDRGIWNTRTQSGQVKTASGHLMKLCRAGTPDRVFADGLNVWIEVKMKGEVPTVPQMEAIAELKRNGSLVFVIDDVIDFDRLLRILKNRLPIMHGLAKAIEDLQIEIDAELDTFRKTNNGK